MPAREAPYESKKGHTDWQVLPYIPIGRGSVVHEVSGLRALPELNVLGSGESPVADNEGPWGIDSGCRTENESRQNRANR